MSNFVPFPGAASVQTTTSALPATNPQYATATDARSIQPGSITYTSTINPRTGQPQYHAWIAKSVAYQTQEGAVEGIQWVLYDDPNNAAAVAAASAAGGGGGGVAFPSAPGGAARGGIPQPNYAGHSDRERERIKEWQREVRPGEKDADKARKKEAKHHAKLQQQYEKEAREREEKGQRRERKLSNAIGLDRGVGAAVTGAIFGPAANVPPEPRSRKGSNATPYEYLPSRSRRGSNAGYERDRKISNGARGAILDSAEMERRLAAMRLERERDRDRGYGSEWERQRTVSGGAKVLERPRKLSFHEPERERPRRPSGSYDLPRPPYYPGAGPAAPGTGYPTGQYGYAKFDHSPPNRMPAPLVDDNAGALVVQGGHASARPQAYAAPKRHGNSPPNPSTPHNGYGHSPSGGHPSSHLPGYGGHARETPATNYATFPSSAYSTGAPTPSVRGQPLMPTNGAPMFDPKSPPIGWSREFRGARPFRHEPVELLPSMDFLFTTVPTLPAALVDHDVQHEDWIRFIKDLSMAWAGHIGSELTGGKQRKPATIAADIIDVWNHSFYNRRGVDIVMLRGNIRQTGPTAGALEYFKPDSSSDESSSESESSEDDDEGYAYPYATYGVQRGPNPHLQESRLARRQAKAMVRAERQKRREKKRRQLEKTYSLWLTSVPSNPSVPLGIPA